MQAPGATTPNPPAVDAAGKTRLPSSKTLASQLRCSDPGFLDLLEKVGSVRGKVMMRGEVVIKWRCPL